VKNNVALYNLIISIVVAASGCGGAIHSEWDGPRGHGHYNPVSADYRSDDEFEICRRERREQRLALLCDAGILSGARCDTSAPATVTVGYREAVQLICEQDDRREADGQPRHMSREDCTALLASVPADATGEVVASAPPPPPASVTDPYILRILTMNPALWQDDHAFCMNATSSYGVPGSGGVYSGGYGFGGTSGMYLPAGAVVGTGPAPIVPVITAR
jgi:hypothetical protein